MLYAREGSPESQGGVPGGFAASARYAVGKANGVTALLCGDDPLDAGDVLLENALDAVGERELRHRAALA